jgi:hypothetical protein
MLSYLRHQIELSGERHAPGALAVGNDPQGTRCIGGWAATKASLNTVAKRGSSCPYQESNPDFPVV